MIRALWAGAIAALLLLGGCASWPAGEPGDRQDGGYERSGGGY